MGTKRVAFRAVAIFAWLAVWVGCVGDAPVYTLSTTANPPEGGSVSRSLDQTHYNAGTEVTLTAVHHSGYVFIGWSGALSSTGPSVKVTMDSDLSLIANFKKSGTRFTVSFNTNGGSPSSIGPVAVDSGGALGTDFPASPVRDGHKFVVWFDWVDGVQYTAQTPVTKDVALTAQWAAGNAKSFTVSFDTDGGSPSILSSVSIDSGSTLGMSSAPLPADPTKQGFSFGGWFSGQTQYAANTVISQSVTLTAKWLRHLTLSFDTDGGNPFAISPVTVDSGSAWGAKMPADPTMPGYTFGGWFDEASQSQYTASTVMTESVTLVAAWIKRFTVSFNSDDGSYIVEVAVVAVDSGKTLASSQLPLVDRAGYTFVGWFNEDEQYLANTTEITQNVALTAVWANLVITDRRDDNRTYKTVRVGNYTWMAENLRYAIAPSVVSNKDSSWCYEGLEAECAKYGRLYNWSAANRACPIGWRLPDTAEWRDLIRAAGGIDAAGDKLKSKNRWDGGGNGTDNYEFSALPGGFRYSDGNFGYVGAYGYWWSSTENGVSAYARNMTALNGYVDEVNDNDKNNGLSVRCVRD